MDWEGGREGGVEDRRGSSGGGGLGAPHLIGGGGIAVIVIALIAYFVFHIDPRVILSDLSTDSQVEAPADPG